MKMKKLLSLLLAALLILSSVPLSAFASDGATITLGSNAQTDDTIDPAGVEFTYYVEINGAAVNDSYTGSDGEVYTAVNGNITLPYDVTVSIPVADGDSYSIYRYEYDNAAYALIEQSYAARGTIASYEYYYTVNGTEVSLTESGYNAATNNGQNLTINKYVTRDANGDIAEIYDESEVESVVGYDVIRTEGVSTTYSLEQNTHYYLPSTYNQYAFSADLDIKYSSKKQWFITTYTYDYTLTGTTTYSGEAEIDLTDAAGSGSTTSNSDARAIAKSSALTDLGRYAYRATAESITADTGKTAVLSADILSQLNNEEWQGSTDQAYTYSCDIYAFEDLEQVTYEYGARETTADRELLFDAAITAAPTGTFALDYAVIDDTTTLPMASSDAAFELRDENGNVLSAGTDYTFSTNPCSINVLSYSIGCMEYMFSDIPAGTYTVVQTDAPEGYAIDDTEYSFTVDRKTGEVSGESFSNSSWNSGVTALTNNSWSILSLYSFNIFKNSAFSFTFSNFRSVR